MIQLQQVTLQRGQKILLNHADLTIHAGQKVGVVGANGSGKTSLFFLLQGSLSPDHGELLLPKNINLAHIKQSLPSGSVAAVDYALQGDNEYTELISKLKDAEEHHDGLAIANIHQRLGEIDGYALPSQAAKILLGLGFNQDELKHAVDTFSGGWRMRLNLAQVLMARADLLLLDEPTNHLDLEAIFWLEEWLRESKQTILLISHDREFLDRVTTHTVFFSDKRLHPFVGNYSAFEKQWAEQLMLQQAMYEKQQHARVHLQKFVDRFRYKASKAKQAQSRLKMLDKMQWVSAVHQASPFRFGFKPTPKADNPMLLLRDVSVGYDDSPILKGVNLSVRDGDRIGLIGPNGAGKSTLVKLLALKLDSQSGEFIKSNKLKIGYFAQHQLEQLDFEESALVHLQRLDGAVSELEARKYLGSFNFQGDDVFRKIAGFSGGEKARLVLALLIWQAPNLLLLDEPTNHLDLDMREALSLALQEYEGAMIMVSHDRFLLNSVTNELLLVVDGGVNPFDGDVDDYRDWMNERLQNITRVTAEPSKPTLSNYAAQKTRQKLKSQLTKLEKKIAILQDKLSKLDAELGDTELYLSHNKEKLDVLLQDRQLTSNSIAGLEDNALSIMHQLEEAEN